MAEVDTPHDFLLMFYSNYGPTSSFLRYIEISVKNHNIFIPHLY